VSTMAEHSEVLDADPARCFEAVAGFDTYPEWMPAFRDVRVLERDAEGRGVLVEFRIDAKLREVRYVLRHHFDAPRRISWDYVEGDAKDVDGEWRFEDAGDGRTRVTYSVSFDVGGFVPGSVKRALAEQAVRSSLGALAKRVGAA
jgi:ribosome-associated toxin RatA of RatAB toxin-antitoxin module